VKPVVNPSRGIPTSLAYWELRAEQVLNRVFEPEKPIEVELLDSPMPVPLSGTTPPLTPPLGINPANRPNPQPLLALTSGAVIVVAGVGLAAVGLWNQSQQAIQQERNMLLIERLRSMGPASAPDTATTQLAPTTPVVPGPDGDAPPPPPGEAWMEELASLPAADPAQASVLRVPVSGRITSPAPAASAQASGGGSRPGEAAGSSPLLVGVVQVPGQSGSAIFQIGGSSTSAAVGEGIGSSGWRLRSANGDSAVIEKGGEQRRVSISSGF
jgi:hypothetical protein